MRCPTCERSALPDATACPEGHVLVDEAGIVRLLDADLRERVARLELAVAEWRTLQGRVPLPPEALATLPGGSAVAGDHEWRLRRIDLDLVATCCSRSGGRDDATCACSMSVPGTAG